MQLQICCLGMTNCKSATTWLICKRARVQLVASKRSRCLICYTPSLLSFPFQLYVAWHNGYGQSVTRPHLPGANTPFSSRHAPTPQPSTAWH
jgi:hypothetical protein